MKFFDSLSKMDMVFSSSKVDDQEAATRPMLEVTLMDWWFCAAKSLAIRDKLNAAEVKCLFVVET